MPKKIDNISCFMNIMGSLHMHSNTKKSSRDWQSEPKVTITISLPKNIENSFFGSLAGISSRMVALFEHHLFK